MRRLVFMVKGYRARFAGATLIILGALAIYFPFATGEWSLALLSFPLGALSVAEMHAAFDSPRRAQISAYLPGALALLAAIVVFFAPALVLSGLLLLLTASLVVDGGSKLFAALRNQGAARAPLLINGIIDIALAFLLWFLRHLLGTTEAVGVVIGLFVIAAGWRMLMFPEASPSNRMSEQPDRGHPDPKLYVPTNLALTRLGSDAMLRSEDLRRNDVQFVLTMAVVFFAIHFGRMPTADTWLGLVSPIVATSGDFLMTVAVAALLFLPVRLLWRRLTRPIERLAWSLRIATDDGTSPMKPAVAWLMNHWLDWRFMFSVRLRASRTSLFAALLLILRLGLPITAFFVAINPIWGFTWYFNTESWASGIYQKVTELRVDRWRSAMTDAVARTYGADLDELVRIQPSGTEQPGDFSFLVIGDPGEGDASQYSLISRYLELGRRDDIKFLIISTDVVYPAGSMNDYEGHFYLPLKGFFKPVYAIPGNHDWFDALEGFNANFLEPIAARAAMSARVEVDLRLTSTNNRRIETLIREASRLRGLYGTKVGTQRAPFFELQTERFSLLAIDTGIMRSVDDRQSDWLVRALERSRGKFIMAIVGHPRFAGGADTAIGDENFKALYDQLSLAGVAVVMAGDTHDFEYYKEAAAGGRVLHHFVNGGGGAYLSIGTALDFPKRPAVDTTANYPSAAALRSKLATETPLWKQPFLYWIKWFNAWPFSVEALSGVFDFNRAPFFQSFMEVRVEASNNRVVYVLHGVDGPLRWHDLDIRGSVLPNGVAKDDAVEFTVPFRRD